MNRKTTTIVTTLILLAAFAAGVVWYAQRLAEQSQKAAEDARKATEEQRVVSSTAQATLDTSNWKTYRNEKYGFEFKLSENYNVPQNLSNQRHSDQVGTYLDEKKDEYWFSSREGLKIVDEVAGRGDASDSWAIKIRVLNYSVEFEKDFAGWVRKNDNADVEKLEVVTLSDGRSVNYVSWASIGNDYSVFFTNGKSVVEIETFSTNFFSDGQPDYFTAILGSFQYFR